ncbi:MAG: hypothetical protein AAGA30_20815 [Planctomycetota bacterium]
MITFQNSRSRNSCVVLATFSILSTSQLLLGQIPNSEEIPRPNPMIMVLDVNRDHVISQQELQLANERLSLLDRDQNGYLTPDEFAHAMPKRNRRNESIDESDLQNRMEDYLERLLKFDIDSDGQIAKSELPTRLHGSFGQWDRDENEIFDAEEMRIVAIAAVSDHKRILDGESGFSIGRPSPPEPERIAREALRFDHDGNGELNSLELTNFAMSYLRNLPGKSGKGKRNKQSGGRSRRSGGPRS